MVQSKPDDWERFGRARKASSPWIEELNKWRAEPRPFDVASYYGQVLIHRAHTVMLAEEGIITKEEAALIVNGIKKVEKMAQDNPKLVGYMSTETALIKKVGEAGGKMHIGRSRNDLGHTQRRLYYRDQMNRLIASIIEFRARLIETAERNLDTVMPGYTHWRQAQPITLAHYIMGHVEAAGRSVKRLEDVYSRTNISPLGSAAFAGTGWPVNRERTMEFLGFDGLMMNSHDGVAAIDYYMEFAAALAIHMSNLSRLAEDLQIWSSDEFKLLDLDEAYAGTSSIMPQKKNPLVLEQVKSYSAESIGAMVSTITSMKGTAYTNIVDRMMLEPVIIDTAVGSTNVMGGVVQTLIPLKENMMNRLREGFSTMTDLTDTLVRLYNLSFRQAHDIIVDVTIDTINKGMKAEEITPEMISESAKKVIGESLTVPENDLRQALDPSLNVRRRNGIGGPAPDAVKANIEAQKGRVNDEKIRLAERLGRIDRAKNILYEAEENLR
ncbi:MAG: argininosuccinate lyase [Candidatus Bathyarchaeota archaeon]|nr:argininosuccinate lyase [Candidatus Bathyarchaeota archaeon]